MLHSNVRGQYAKPTGIVRLCLLAFETHEETHHNKFVPAKQFKGKDEETGAWDTSAAKEYPPFLSVALARAMVGDACRHSIYGLNAPHENFFHSLAKYQLVLDPNIDDREAFGAGEETMLAID